MSSDSTRTTSAQPVRIPGDTVDITPSSIPSVIQDTTIAAGELPERDLTIRETQYLRAVTDPILTATPETETPRQQSPVRHCVIPARLAELESHPDEERIELVTWPETALYLCTGALLKAQFSAANPLEYYRYAVAKTWAEYGEFISDGPWDDLGADFPEPSEVEPRDATGSLRSLRETLKAKRDQAFIDHVYPDIETAGSKSFWTR